MSHHQKAAGLAQHAVTGTLMLGVGILIATVAITFAEPSLHGRFVILALHIAALSLCFAASLGWAILHAEEGE